MSGQDQEHALHAGIEHSSAFRKAYHKATCEHVTDRAVHHVGKVRKFTACKVCLPEAYTVESVTRRKPRCFSCPRIIAFAAGIWIGVVFSCYGLPEPGSSATMLKDTVKENSFPYAERKAFRTPSPEDEVALVGRRRRRSQLLEFKCLCNQGSVCTIPAADHELRLFQGSRLQRERPQV